MVNALLIPFILSAIRMYESGFASAEDIDRGLVLGAAHPQGPLALADLIGLDTTKAVAESLYEEFKEPLYAAPPLRCSGWSTPACSVARPAAGSIPTTELERLRQSSRRAASAATAWPRCSSSSRTARSTSPARRAATMLACSSLTRSRARRSA